MGGAAAIRCCHRVLLAAAPGYDTVLDCHGRTRALWLDGRHRSGELPRVTVRGITFRNGRAAVGGCIRADDAALHIHDCTFVNCVAEGEGAIERATTVFDHAAPTTAADTGTGGAVSAWMTRNATQAAATITITASAFHTLTTAPLQPPAVLLT